MVQFSAVKLSRSPKMVGNWKAEIQSIKSARTLALGIKNLLYKEELLEREDWDMAPGSMVWIAPSFIHIPSVRAEIEFSLKVGAQNVHPLNAKGKGPLTGEITPEMLVDAEARFVILGHSERRRTEDGVKSVAESDEILNWKLQEVIKRPFLDAIFCVGETLAEREAKKTEEVLSRQVKIGFNNVLKEDVGKKILERGVVKYDLLNN